MKKLLLTIFPILLLPTLSACQDKEHSIVVINAGDNSSFIIELKPAELENLIESKQQFTLVSYSPTCVHCKDLEPKIEKYTSSTKKSIYRIDLTQDGGADLIAKYPNIYPDSSVPRISYIANGDTTYSVNSNKFSSYTALSNIMNKHYLSSNITLVSEMNWLREYVEHHQNYIAISYNLNDLDSLKTANDYLITREFAEAKKDVVLINYALFAENSAEIRQLFNAESDSFIHLTKDYSKIKTIDYKSADGKEISELVSSL